MRTNQRTKPTNQQTNQQNKRTSFHNQLTVLPNPTITILTYLACLFVLFFAPCAFAADFAGSLKSVSITDSAGANKPPVGVINYTQNGDTFTFDASGSSDSDGSIVEYKWDFGDGKVGAGAVVSHQYTAVGSFAVTLSSTDNGGSVAISQIKIAVAPAIDVAVSFQPADVGVTSGYIVDSGLPYNGTRGYGWVQLPSSVYYGSRDRDNQISLNQSYDTLLWISAQGSPAPIWEMDVPSGNYLVTVCMGDPTYGTDRQDAQVEGVPIISNESLTPTLRWIERSATVGILDGKLTLTFTGSSQYARPSWVKVVSQ